MMISDVKKSQAKQQVQYLLSQAVAKHRQGQIEAAIALYLKSLEIEKLLPDWVYENLIILLSQVGRSVPELNLRENALKIHAKSDKVYRAIGLASNQQGDFENSISFYFKSLEINQNQPDWLYSSLVEMLVDNAQLQQAIAIGHLGLKFHDDCGWLNYHLAEAFATGENWAEAILYYNKAAQIKPDLSNIQEKINLAINNKSSKEKVSRLHDQAVVKQKAGQIEAAIALYLESLGLQEKQPAWVYENVITLLVQANKSEQGLSLREQAVKNHPDSDKVYRAIGLAFKEQGDCHNSINCYLKSLEINQNQPEWLYSSLVEMLVNNAQLQQAIEIGHLGLKFHDDCSWLNYHLAEAFATEENWAEAILYYNKAVQIKSDLPNIQDKINLAIERDKKTADQLAKEKACGSHTQAVVKHKEGNLDEAIALYLEAIELDNNQPAWVYGNTITLLAKVNRLDEAVKLGKKALINHKESDETYRALGLTLNKKHYFKSSIDCYLKSLEINQNQPDWLYASLVEMYVSSNQFQQAIKFGNIGLKFHENSSWIQHHLEEAFAALENGGDIQPNSHIDHKNKSNIQISDNLLSLLDGSLKSAKKLLDLGDSFFNQKMWDEAIAFYEQAVAIDEKMVWAYYNLGRALTKQNKIDQAIDIHLQAIEIAPDFPEVYPTVGDLLFEKQRWQEAKKAYQKAVALKPELIWSQYNLGRALLQLDEIDDAIVAFLKVIEIDNKFTIAYPNLINLLVNKELWGKVIETCHKSLKYNSDWQTAYLYLGKAQLKLERFEEAIVNYNLAAKIFSENPEVHEGLGDVSRCQAQQKNLTQQKQVDLKQKALDYYNKALLIQPNAVNIYHKILAIDPKNSDAYARLAKVLEAKDQLEGAIQFYQIAKNICPENLKFSLQLYRAIANNKKSPSQNIKVGDVVDLTLLQKKLILRCDSRPLVSIIIPVYNKIGYTLNCLKSLKDNISSSISIEIIVIDDGSRDETQEISEKIIGLRYIKNPENMGFIKSCNNGAAHAKGKYLCFLNNDTEVCPQWLESMLETIEKDQTIGIVGSKLVYPNGMLQEAGGVIWSNASGWNYGKMENPQEPEYNYVREVDYCSGASLLVRKSNFDSLQGFAKEFAPAYYEDTDLCFAVRDRLGLKVVYQPKSQIIHYEGISSGTSTTSGVKKYQAINSVKFARKWQQVLQNHCVANDPLNPLIAPRRLGGQKTVLIVEHHVPYYDKESGYRRLFEIIKILKKIDCHIIYAPDQANPEEPYTSELQNMGIEVLYRSKNYQVSIEAQIARVLPIVDFAWICRPDLNQKYAWLVRKHNPQAKIIYDTIDLHYVRLKRAWELLEDVSEEKNALEKEWQGMQKHELEMAEQADITLTVTSVEKAALLQQGIKKVEVVPNIHKPYLGASKTFAERHGILFIGGYKHVPNIDCVEWLCKTIMPIVWQTLPEVKVTLLGSHPNETVKQLSSDRVTVPGYVKDVSSYFLNHRVFVSPLRFGAGMKGKIGQSLEYGLPVVSTKIGAEGIGLTDGADVLIGDDASSFANQIIRLYENQHLWNYLASNSQKAILPYTPKYIQNILSELIHGI